MALLAFQLGAQNLVEKEKKWSVDGYVKDLLTVNLIRGLDSAWMENQIHHRINFKWFPTSRLTTYVEVRNRIFWGDFVKNVPNYSDLIDMNNDFFDLSVTSLETKSWVIHSMVDRAYVEWNHKDWEIRVGRQRINWGVTLVWNPNDLFNAFSFFDFDYEERPGSDGIRIKKYTGVASSLELASNVADNLDQLITAGLWKVNKWEYDFQFLAAKAQQDLALGVGWAGSIKDAGFKGEVTFLQPYGDSADDPVVLAALSGDYSFESSLYLHTAFYLNSDGDSNPENPFLNTRLSRLNVRSLSPYLISTLVQASYTFTPLVNGGMALILYPGSNALFINPSVAISLKKNLDLDLIAQIFFDHVNGTYQAANKFTFIRVKWSY